MIRRLTPSDEGFTFVELIVYSLILIIVMGIGATLLIRTVTAQRDTIAIAEANNLAQLTFKELETDLRNASMAEIADAGNLLVMQTRLAYTDDPAESQWRCVGYYLAPATGQLRRVTANNGTQTQEALAAAGTSGMAAATADWSVIREGFSKGTSPRAFGTADGIVSVSKLVRLTLSVDTRNEHKPVTFSKSVSLRPQGTVAAFCN